jgi:hypothetical protein
MNTNNEILDTDEETYLTEHNILLLKQMFKDKAAYCEYMKTLWVLRDLAVGKIEIEVQGVTHLDMKNPISKIFILTNKLIGALLQDDMAWRWEI